MPKAIKKPASPAAPLPANGAVGEVLTLAEAAAYLRVSEGTVVDLVHSQDLPGRLIGSDWRFLKPAIQQWLATASPTTQTRKLAQLALAGKYKDDPDLAGICEEAYRQRGRPLTEAK